MQSSFSLNFKGLGTWGLKSERDFKHFVRIRLFYLRCLGDFSDRYFKETEPSWTRFETAHLNITQRASLRFARCLESSNLVKKCCVFGKVPLLWHRILCLAYRAWFKTFYCAQSIFCATKTVQIWFKISDHNRWCSIVTKKVWNWPKMGNFGSQSLKLSQEYIQEISEETGCELFILIKAEQLYLCFTSTL